MNITGEKEESNEDGPSQTPTMVSIPREENAAATLTSPSPSLSDNQMQLCSPLLDLDRQRREHHEQDSKESEPFRVTERLPERVLFPHLDEQERDAQGTPRLRFRSTPSCEYCSFCNGCKSRLWFHHDGTGTTMSPSNRIPFQCTCDTVCTSHNLDSPADLPSSWPPYQRSFQSTTEVPVIPHIDGRLVGWKQAPVVRPKAVRPTWSTSRSALGLDENSKSSSGSHSLQLAPHCQSSSASLSQSMDSGDTNSTAESKDDKASSTTTEIPAALLPVSKQPASSST